MKNKSIFFNMTVISMGLYLVIYLIGVIYQFDFYNPVRWVLDIPRWEGVRRLGLFFMLIFGYGAHYCFARAIKNLFKDDIIGVAVGLYVLSVCMLGFIIPH